MTGEARLMAGMESENETRKKVRNGCRDAPNIRRDAVNLNSGMRDSGPGRHDSGEKRTDGVENRGRRQLTHAPEVSVRTARSPDVGAGPTRNGGMLEDDRPGMVRREPELPHGGSEKRHLRSTTGRGQMHQAAVVGYHHRAVIHHRRGVEKGAASTQIDGG